MIELSIEEIIKILPFLNPMIQDGVTEDIKKRMSDTNLPAEIRLRYSEIYIKCLERFAEFKQARLVFRKRRQR